MSPPGRTAAAAADTAPQVCHAERCSVEVPAGTFMCHRHMFMLPPPLREAIKTNYRAGQEHDTTPSPEYLAIAQAAVDAVAHKESRAVPRAPRPRRGEPVQLALFDLA